MFVCVQFFIVQVCMCPYEGVSTVSCMQRCGSYITRTIVALKPPTVSVMTLTHVADTHTQDVSHTLLISVFMVNGDCSCSHRCSNCMCVCWSVLLLFVRLTKVTTHTLYPPAALGAMVLIEQTEASHWLLADVQQPITNVCQLESQSQRYRGQNILHGF